MPLEDFVISFVFIIEVRFLGSLFKKLPFLSFSFLFSH